jgi:glutamine cyclotransferase
MVRLLNRSVLGLVALLGVALVPSCAAPTQVTESNTSQIAVSPVPESTVGPSFTATVTVAITKDVSHNPISPIPTDTVEPSATEVTTIPEGKDGSSVPNSLPPTGMPDPPEQSLVPVYTYRIVNTYPHDRGAFIQGLVYVDGVLYEGTGRNGQSTLRRVELETGTVTQLRALPAQLFGEGITVFDDKIFQLTWKARLGFVYDKNSFESLRVFTYPTEGWGLTHDGQRLIMSDGTSTLHFLDPETLEETGQVEVYDNYTPVARLNELEYVRGEIFANVWQTDRIVRIDPQTGQVTGWIDLTGLLSEEDRVEVGVLNGIAYDAENDRLFVTGKLWPNIFEIELVPE